jgi:hypothetical protein
MKLTGSPTLPSLVAGLEKVVTNLQCCAGRSSSPMSVAPTEKEGLYPAGPEARLVSFATYFCKYQDIWNKPKPLISFSFSIPEFCSICGA